MANDLLTILNNSGIQQTNNALYQTIKGLIDKPISAPILSSQIQVINVDTSSAPVSIPLSTAVKGLTIFKDISGNASSNNITLAGSVEGVTDPTITTDFGIFRVYVTPLGFFQW